MARVSVVIPTHSRPDLLVRAVQSAKAAAADVEVIVVDDASRNGTAQACLALEDITYIRLEQNRGVADARNVGLLASSTDYVSFLDDDDLRLPGSLDLQIDALEDAPDAAFCGAAVVHANQYGTPTGGRSSPEPPGGDLFWELVELGVPLTPLAVVFRRDSFMRVGLFRRVQGIDDWDMFVRMAELSPVVVLEDVVGIYREPTPSSGQGSSDEAAHLRRVRRHQRLLLRLPRARAASRERRRAARRTCSTRVVDTLLWRSVVLLREGFPLRAGANLAVSLRLRPWRLIQTRTYRALLVVVRSAGR